MSSTAITIRKTGNGSQRFLVEIDANRLERLAANLGFFNQSFLDSLDQAEKDYKAGRTRKVHSLKSLRSQ